MVQQKRCIFTGTFDTQCSKCGKRFDSKFLTRMCDECYDEARHKYYDHWATTSTTGGTIWWWR